ncbi:hypothetical protein X941_5549 [Burkholderia pseudomallei MSHR5569]|nr:hypothetical protein X941_5549 [Burkholderia pseudomallei MSHR5569]
MLVTGDDLLPQGQLEKPDGIEAVAGMPWQQATTGIQVDSRFRHAEQLRNAGGRECVVWRLFSN